LPQTIGGKNPNRVRPTRTRFSSRGPAAKRGTVLRFRLRKRGTVVIVVRTADCSVLGQRRVRGHRGVNRIRFDGRVHGRPLAPGRYSILLVVVRGSSRTQLGAIGVEVVPPGRRLTNAQRSAPLGTGCVAPASATPLPAAIVSTTPPPEAGAADLVRSVTKKSPKTSGPGVSLKPPRLPVPVINDAPTWLGVLLVALFGLSVAGLAVYVTRFPRSSEDL
jgi:hypothetical protein